ncbi:nucleotide pyrophosphohydrolase, partial [Bacillus cereus]|nr:nucleotide pyrophosphohydrolase [Bacillus cereus]
MKAMKNSVMEVTKLISKSKEGQAFMSNIQICEV